MSEKSSRWRSFVRGALLAGIALIMSALGPAAAQSWSLTTLYSFCAASGCADGREPRGTLISDKIGNLYGTTAGGGAESSGTVFKLDPFGHETVLHNFCSRNGCKDGLRPLAGLIMDATGILYGTTRGRGSLTRDGNPGGAAFAIEPGAGEAAFCKFGSTTCPTGKLSMGSLTMDASGNLYGTTSWGGTNFIAGFYCCGIVFKLPSGGGENVLYSFCSLADCHDGARPEAGLIMDASGNFYGTTFYGGSNQAGTVFELAAGGEERVLYSFCTAANPNCTDGAYPKAGLVREASGNLYGTTLYGGINGKGTVFEVTAGGEERVLYSFCSVAACADGEYPQSALIIDASGNLYGTTQSGGANADGTVFVVAPTGQETVLHSFCSATKCSDGKSPLAGLLMDESGSLYGTTSAGGANGKGGTVFELAHP